MDAAARPECVGDTDPYSMVMLRRIRLAGKLYVVGQVVRVRGETALRMVAHTCGRGDARPADRRTRLDVEVMLALQAASGPGGGQAGRGPRDPTGNHVFTHPLTESPSDPILGP